MARRRIIWPLLLAAALTGVLAGARRTAARSDADAGPTGSRRFGIPPTRDSPGFAVCDSTVRPPPGAGGPSSKAPSRTRDDTEDDATVHRPDAKSPPFKAAPPSLEDDDDGEDGASLKPAPEARDDEDEDKDDLDDHDDAEGADDADGD